MTNIILTHTHTHARTYIIADFDCTNNLNRGGIRQVIDKVTGYDCFTFVLLRQLIVLSFKGKKVMFLSKEVGKLFINLCA